ncbi:MAG: hypothetical protein IT370_01580 [Deltaproteobacteria bacterium]|nr:hypothetical protein [Deltaproteobacteria bacterium]
MTIGRSTLLLGLLVLTAAGGCQRKRRAGAAGEGGPRVLDMGISAATACAALADGRVLCWGDNRDGTLGDGTMKASARPVAVVGLGDAVEVEVGKGKACALKRDHTVWCWGALRPPSDAAPPEDVAPPRPLTPPEHDAVATQPATVVGYLAGAESITMNGDWNLCARLAGGEVRCFGYVNVPTRVPELQGASVLAAGPDGVAGVAQGAITVVDLRLPHRARTLTAADPIEAIDAIAVGTALCVRGARKGQLGIHCAGWTSDVLSTFTTPALATAPHTFALGASTGSFVAADGRLGRFGIGDVDRRAQTASGEAAGDGDIVAVWAGAHYSCHARSTSALRCQGALEGVELAAREATIRLP